MFGRVHRLLRRTRGEPDTTRSDARLELPATSRQGPMCHIDGTITGDLSMLREGLGSAQAAESETPVLDSAAEQVHEEPALDQAAALEAEQRAVEARLHELLAEDTLDFEQIAEARTAIETRPESERPELYRQLASKVAYRNQRDNQAIHGAADARRIGSSVPGDVMCNVTSLAMALEGLGLGADESEKQLEDQLDELLVSEGLGSRYELQGQAAVAKRFGAETDRVWTPAFRGADAARAWYHKNVLPRLERGETATLSMAWGPKGDLTHIVRLEWVQGDGVLVDDPYGRLLHNGSFFTYDTNDVSSSEGEGAKGEDRLWSWLTVALVNGGRYVQFLSPAS